MVFSETLRVLNSKKSSFENEELTTGNALLFFQSTTGNGFTIPKSSNGNVPVTSNDA